MVISKDIVAVTGAAHGIGKSVARAFAASGNRVAVIDVDENAALSTAREIERESGVKTIGVVADVSSAGESKVAYEAIVDALGEISVLVNNAGILPQRKGWIEELPPEYFEQMMAVHLGGALNWSRLVLGAMRLAGYGRIINISSVNALLAVPHRLGYVTAKKAMLGFTEGLALDTARSGITVNAIAVGYTLTERLNARAESGILDIASLAERTPVGRNGMPEDIAHAVTFLANRKSGFITGTTLVVDGGLTIRGDWGEQLDHRPD